MKNTKVIQPKIVIVTGASSGIGKACAERFIQKGCIVYNLSRSAPEKQSSLIEFILTDVTKPEQIEAAVKQIIAKHNRIDILVNNAGMGISGSVESTNLGQVEKIFNVNFHGVFNCTKAVLPHMRTQKSGKIINMSSVGGIFPLPYQSFYAATKAAVLAFSRAVRIEVKSFGIKVVAVCPGDVKTGFTKAREKNTSEIEAYAKRAEKSVSKMEKDEQFGAAPDVVAKIVVKAAFSKNPKPYIVHSFTYKFLTFIAKFLPTRLVDKFVGGLYG